EMDGAGWRPFLERWSRERVLVEGTASEGWLGFPPASEEAVLAAEARLGRRLPPSLREFLLVTDGWREAGPFIYRLAGAAELAWLRDTDDEHWIEAYSGEADEDCEGCEADEDCEDDDGALLRRTLRISLDGDSALMLLDPEEVDERGEWQAYWLSSWSGMGPEPRGSFHDLMYGEYTSFHRLGRQGDEGRSDEGRCDEGVERGRSAALAGDPEGALAELARPVRFGRWRAELLRWQLLAFLGDWRSTPLRHVVAFGGNAELVERDPFFARELLPLLFARREQGVLDYLSLLRGVAAEAVGDLDARRREPGFRISLGNAEFDAVARGVADRLAAESDSAARRRLGDALWPELRAAMAGWRPVGENHVAPVVLLAEPVLSELITPDRGRELLAQPRG
ncbi:SMI1/KNR4 family protein, partial [Streptomyces hainanensis]